MNRPTREDCWTDSDTHTLIDAWGDRYVRLNRGNLRHTQWKEIANAVNALQHAVKPPKTYVQCKNRIDTLKKKYKLEKSKPAPSKWVFYHSLHSLIGVNAVTDNNPDTVTLTVKPSKTKVMGSGGSSESSLEGRVVRKKRVELSEGGAVRELARVILRFGEIYERIESSKQKQVMELEKQRMEFTKDLELQRMNVLFDAQLEAHTMKRSEFASTSGKM